MGSAISVVVVVACAVAGALYAAARNSPQCRKRVAAIVFIGGLAASAGVFATAAYAVRAADGAAIGLPLLFVAVAAASGLAVMRSVPDTPAVPALAGLGLPFLAAVFALTARDIGTPARLVAAGVTTAFGLGLPALAWRARRNKAEHHLEG